MELSLQTIIMDKKFGSSVKMISGYVLTNGHLFLVLKKVNLT